MRQCVLNLTLFLVLSNLYSLTALLHWEVFPRSSENCLLNAFNSDGIKLSTRQHASWKKSSNDDIDYMRESRRIRDSSPKQIFPNGRHPSRISQRNRLQTKQKLRNTDRVRMNGANSRSSPEAFQKVHELHAPHRIDSLQQRRLIRVECPKTDRLHLRLRRQCPVAGRH